MTDAEESRNTWVFGFGSLVDPDDLAEHAGPDPMGAIEWAPARLEGFRRAWNVGMRNIHDRRDDKFFVFPDDSRYDGVVVSLGLERSPAQAVNGIVFRTGNAGLAGLDWREKRYRRRDVTALVRNRHELGRGATVFAYLPRGDAVATYVEGARRGNAAASLSYRDKVVAAFAALGDSELAEYHATTTEPSVPLLDLRAVAPGSNRHTRG